MSAVSSCEQRFMHIGYVISRYPAVSHTFIQREVLGLRKLGWTVTTISIRRAASKDLLTDADRDEARQTRVIVPPGIFTLLTAWAYAFFFTPGNFLRALSCAWHLRRPGIRGMLWEFFYFLEALLVHRLCRKKGIRHLHAHFANVASDVALLASILNAGTFSYTMHGPTEFFDIAHHRLAEKTRAARFVVCISDFARSQLMSMVAPEHWPKLQVVHCGVDPQQFEVSRLQRLDAGTRPLEIFCVARLAPVKGHAILFQAVGELALRGHDVRITVAGDGPLRTELIRLAEVLGIHTHVRFLGSVGQDVIHSLYSAADIFVLPSFAEGVPVVLMEAMAARCPVIATRIAGISELIEHGVTGLLVNPGRADLLSDAVERLLLNPRATERMAFAACEKVRREFNLNTVAAQLAAIFQKTLPDTATAKFSGKAHRISSQALFITQVRQPEGANP
jgi:colanic acid/amylovoran biosynthesis glycosyltransferase